MLDGLTSVLGTTEQNDIATSRCLHGELVEGQAFTTGLFNTGTSGSSESESGNVEFWDSQHTVVVGDGADNADGLVFVGFGGRFGRDFADDS